MQDPIQQLPQMPDNTPWWGWLLAFVVGGAGMRYMAMWLEDRRLRNGGHRELLQKELDEQKAEVQSLRNIIEETQANRISALEQENTQLHAKIDELEQQVLKLRVELAARPGLAG